MYAVIVTGGKQYRVEKGDVIYVEKLDAEAESTYTFDTVPCGRRRGQREVWRPHCCGRVRHGQGAEERQGQEAAHLDLPPEKGSARKMGHRQPFTKVEITEIKG